MLFRSPAVEHRQQHRLVIAEVFDAREVVIEVGDRYEKGNLWFAPLPHFRPAGFGIETGLSQPGVQTLLRQPRPAAFLRWSRFPFVQADGTGAVWLNDYRYANAGSYGWSAMKLQ